MFTKILTVAMMVAAAAAFAVPVDLAPTTPQLLKGDAHVGRNLAFDRDGGETFATAVPIPLLPFVDTGATCDNVDDYDEVCPYTQSTSPDVVYSLVSPSTGLIDVDLCGSLYDTKLYMYDEALALVACNDDFYFDDVCGVYVSRLEVVQVVAGATYYIVVDGYGGDCGEYVISIGTGSECFLDCPAAGIDEGEPALEENYVDDYNSGCGHVPDILLQPLYGVDGESLILCGRSGWYLSSGSSFRDTDWFLLTIGATGTVEITADAEYATYFFELAPMNCNEVAVAQQITVGPCLAASMTITGAPHGTAWFWAGPTMFEAPGGDSLLEYDYIVWFDGLEGPVATEGTTWSTLKCLYE